MAGVKSPAIVALDSNFLVATRKAGSAEGKRLEHWLNEGHAIEVSAVAWSEYLCGPIENDDVAITRQLISSIVPFDEARAELAARLFNQTGRRSRTHADCMIAAHAIVRQASLATLNVPDFRPFTRFGLKLL